MQRVDLSRVPRITPEDAHDLLAAGRAAFVDVRSEDQYRARHIAGARSIPLPQTVRLGEALPRQGTIVTY